MAYERLLSPISLGPVRLRNRIVSTAHYTGLSGAPIPGAIDAAYREERARGGVALLVTEGMAVHPTGQESSATWDATDARIVDALSEMATRVRREGAALFGQLRHQGRQMGTRFSRLPLWAPSPIPSSSTREIPHEMDRDQIDQVVRGFAAGAVNVRAAGCDGVELNAAHGFLLHTFLSPFSNLRADEYGGSDENRRRLLLDVCAAVREAIGSGIALGVRMTLEDFTPGGLGPPEVAGIAAALEASGLVDYLSLSQSNWETWSFAAMVPDMVLGPAPYAHLTAPIRAACRLPMVVTGGIQDPDVAERVLAEDRADLVGMNRANIADPHFATKVRLDPERIRPCVALNACWDSLNRGQPLRCAVNPEVGMEGRWAASPPPARLRRVVVVGGGVAGLEAARTAAERGHQVTLFERAAALGGQVAVAARAPGRDRLAAIVRWYERELPRASVELLLATEATESAVVERAPDVTIVASGAHVDLPIGLPSDRPLLTCSDVLRDPPGAPRRAVVVDRDHGFEALGTAMFLAELGWQVVVVSEQAVLGLDAPAISLPPTLTRLKRLGVRVLTELRAVELRGTLLILEDVHTREPSELADVEEVVLAGARRADDGLGRRLAAAGLKVAFVGDCVAPRRIVDAVWEGHVAGRSVGRDGANGARDVPDLLDFATSIAALR